MTKVVDFGQAERNARKKDFEIENKKFEQDHNEVSKVELEQAMEIMAKATGKELYIGTKRSPQSKVRFAQFIQENWRFLRDEKYFTSEEKVFLTDMQCNVSMYSNAIVDDVKKKAPCALTIVTISEMLQTSRPKISRVVNSLIKKGIIAKSISGDFKDSHQAKDYVLFVNPNIIISGSKDDVSEHLILQFKNVMSKHKILRKLPVKLF
ncbi:MarR family transcriptional regulator [Bacillus pseudomycoides]|uniref:MarR family transcriptional regulator n=1 Tax=Bacillus pseudomycoides TaxID=64104 RepID=UPI000BECF6F0|nr:MarR family transcriptional regulator [Bacillus pseudomycoides]PDY00242.1 MarR family transcriptional regulator [Bacillus pseudomycoides]PEK77019.1 MarR family transcriptional regulator [Bacillus pseudomycoides]PEN03696.1 MarR family transcriptional regulator [Bacillus pseudomycoides]PGB77725.1 MarR family transcriptional regulator [Bacillus pseudomycoides]PHE54023.1 MarR family transcriptional regulator [Bacillus pseudomycoides]